MKRTRSVLLTVLLCVLCGGVLLVFWLDHAPKETPPPPTESTEEPDKLLLYTIDDTLDWNGFLTFSVEELTHSKTIPQGFTPDDIMGLSMVTADEYGTLSEHTYLDITVHITCQKLYPALFGYDAPEGDELVPVPLAFADQYVCVYDPTREHPIPSGELRAYECLSDGYEIDYHGTAELEVGDSIRVRLIYIVKDTYLNSTDTLLLFTPQYGIFSADHLRRLGYTRPHILLKGEWT